MQEGVLALNEAVGWPVKKGGASLTLHDTGLPCAYSWLSFDIVYERPFASNVNVVMLMSCKSMFIDLIMAMISENVSLAQPRLNIGPSGLVAATFIVASVSSKASWMKWAR